MVPSIFTTVGFHCGYDAASVSRAHTRSGGAEIELNRRTTRASVVLP
jgi:hypothetical protein